MNFLTPSSSHLLPSTVLFLCFVDQDNAKAAWLKQASRAVEVDLDGDDAIMNSDEGGDDDDKDNEETAEEGDKDKEGTKEGKGKGKAGEEDGEKSDRAGRKRRKKAEQEARKRGKGSVEMTHQDRELAQLKEELQALVTRPLKPSHLRHSVVATVR